MSDKDTISEALEEFRLSEEAESENRKNWLSDVRFARLGEQWPDNVKRQREIDGRPCLTINRMPSMTRQVLNDARQNKPAIKCHPVDSGATRDTADILDGLIRNIEYTSDADVAYDTALDHAVTGGFGYFRITTDYADDDAFEQDIKIERIANPLTVYGDETSTAADSSDWNKAFITELYDEEVFQNRWKDAIQADWETTYKDMPEGWREGEMVRVAEYWSREKVPAVLLKLSDGMVLYEKQYLGIKELLDQKGVTIVEQRPTSTYKVTQKIMSGAEVLETNAWAGKYIPIVPVYGDEVMVEGKRHWISLVRWARDPQIMFNYWRTASTELVALAPKAPWIGRKGAFNGDQARWNTANVISHPYLEYDGNEMPVRQPFAGPPAGALQEALNASDDIKATMGIYDAALGARSNETSGRAIMQRQRESDVATFNYVDNLSRAIRHAGRILVDLIPKVYSAPRIIRVIHEDGSNESVPINQPFVPQQQKDPRAQQYDANKLAQQVDGLTKIYDVTTGKYDVTCEAGPSYTTKREEAASGMLEMGKMFPPMMQVAGDLLVKNLDWPGADDIADRLKMLLPPQLQGADPRLQQMQHQMQAMGQQFQQASGEMHKRIQMLETENSAIKADKHIDAQKIDVDRYKAETDRMQALQAAINPQAIQQLVVQTVAQLLNPEQVIPAEQPTAGMPQG